MGYIKTKELKKLYEADPKGFPTNLRKVFGVKESLTKRSIDEQAAKDLDNLSPAQMARDFVGYEYYDTLEPQLAGNPNFWCRVRGQEAEGGPITASLMSPINVWTSSVLGLYDANVLRGYSLPEFQYRNLSTEKSTIVLGGHKMIRAAYDGTKPTKALAERESAPMVGGAPAFVWTQAVETHQVQTSLTMEAMLSDITGMLQSAAMTVGKATAFNENDRFFDYLWGRVNSYCYNSPDTVGNIPNCNTYQASATGTAKLATTGTAPFNFINAGTGTSYLLTDHISLNAAWLLLNQNYDPVTSWRFVPDKNLKLVVGPDLLVQARKIKNQISAFQRLGYVPTSSGTYPVEQYREEATGPATQFLDFDFEVVNQTYLGVDRLTNAGVGNVGGVNGGGSANNGVLPAASFANASNCWALMSPQGIEYQVAKPIQSNTYPLTGSELASRIAFRGDAIVMSRFVVVDPRHLFAAFPY